MGCTSCGAQFSHILLPGNPEPLGQIELRIGNTKHIVMYGGHLGYGINEEYRGQRYAAKVCNLIKRIALDYSLKRLAALPPNICCFFSFDRLFKLSTFDTGW